MTWDYRENVLDLEPQGPLPPQIYWRRRGLALGIALLVIALLVGGAIALFSGSGSKDATKTSTSQTAQPPNKTPVLPPAASSAEPTPTPTAAVEPPPVLQPGDDCPDSTLAVKGVTNAPQYVIGDQPKFTMVVTNIGLVACKRDVGAAVLAAYVYSLDNKRLWSNLDCAPSNETLVKTFNPGEQVTTEVTWTGMGSAPQCLSFFLTHRRRPRRRPRVSPPRRPPRISRLPRRRPAARTSQPQAGDGQSSRSVIVDSASCDSPSRTCRAHMAPIPSTD